MLVVSKKDVDINEKQEFCSKYNQNIIHMWNHKNILTDYKKYIELLQLYMNSLTFALILILFFLLYTYHILN